LSDENLLFIDAGNNRIGIGTASPATLLEMAAASGNVQLKIDAEGGGAAEAQLDLTSGATATRFFYRASDGNFGFFHQGSTKFRIRGDGEIRINETGDDTNFYGDTGILGATSDAEGIKFQVAYSDGNTSGRVFFAERDADDLGFSLLYAGLTNPVLGGKTMSLALNRFAIVRHNVSDAGSVVMAFNRADSNVAIPGALTIGADAAPVATVDINGGIAVAVVAKTGAYTATSSDHTILCDASGGSFTVTLPAASGVTRIIYHIKKTDSSGNTVTVDGNASETIDGDTTKIISTQYDSMMITCDGSNWHII
jgi:hypothetical protein